MRTILNEENPCTPDCPERNQWCHGSCKRYALYRAAMKDRRDRAAKQRVKQDYFWDRDGRVKRARRGKH